MTLGKTPSRLGSRDASLCLRGERPEWTEKKTSSSFISHDDFVNNHDFQRDSYTLGYILLQSRMFDEVYSFEEAGIMIETIDTFSSIFNSASWMLLLVALFGWRDAGVQNIT